MSLNVTTQMLLAGETTYEAAERIRRVRAIRRERRTPVDKLAERDRLTRYWKACYPDWQPKLCSIAPNFALVHVDSFRPGMLHGKLSLLPGHVPRHLKYKFRHQSKVEPVSKPTETDDEAAAQLDLFA